MKINYTHHLAVNTQNIGESVKFYQEIMGFESVSKADMGECTLVYLRINDDTYMELFDLRGGCTAGELPETQRGLRHIAFDVDSVAEWDRFLTEKGVPYVMEVTEMPPIGKRAILVKDPDGTVIELCETM